MNPLHDLIPGDSQNQQQEGWKGLYLNSHANRSNVDFARQLIEFNFWENQRVWDLAIAPLTDAQFLQAVSYANESIRDKCIHILELEATCLCQIRGDLRRSSDARDDLLDRSAIAARWQEIRQDWSQFAVGLDDDKFFWPASLNWMAASPN